MQWNFTAGNNPPPTHRSATPIPMRAPTPMSSSHNNYVAPSFPEPSHMVPAPPMSAPSTIPAFLGVPGTVPTTSREGRSLERRHHQSHSHSGSHHRHERPHSQDPHHRRVHSHDYAYTRSDSQERHHSRPHSHERHRSREHSRGRDLKHSKDRHHHHSSAEHSNRERRHSTSGRVVVVKPPPNSKVVVVPHRSDVKTGRYPQVVDTRGRNAAQLVDARGIPASQLAPAIKHAIRHLCKPCLHRHSESQSMEQFYPRPEHPAYNPIAYPAPHSTFQYSRCTGRKRALCIGINYTGQDRPLRGCINDALHVRDFLMKHHGFPADQIMVLRDDSTNPEKIPTRKNMFKAMQWLVQGAQKHDSLFFHYSGHGGQTPDEDGDEVDGFDEVIYPVDYQRRGHIVDDDMHSIMVKPLPTGCRLTALFDSCHSGTVLDLSYVYTPSGRKKGVHISSRALNRKATRADVISWSGCRDDQSSADTFQGGQPVGAMSYAFINSLRKNLHPTYQGLLRNLKALLYERFNQTPQLGSSHHIDTNLTFVI